MGNQVAKEAGNQTAVRNVRQQGRRSHLNAEPSPHTSNTPSLAKPVRHKVVVTNQGSPLTSLATSVSTLPGRSRSLKRDDIKSLPPLVSNEKDPESPTRPSFSSSSGSSPSSPSFLGPFMRDSMSTMLVFDSAIAEAENTVAHRRKQKIDTVDIQQKNRMVYDYGEEKEYNRQLRQHYVLKQVFRGNQHVQLANPRRILECACGSGLWTLETAQVFPNTRVIGMDIVPPVDKWNSKSITSFRSSSSKPANISYIYGDILAPLGFPSSYFDYIYQRDAAHIVPMERWPSLVSEFYRVLNPGGQVELVEYDLLFRNTGPVLTLVNDWYEMAAATIGVDPKYADKLPGILKDAGFQDVKRTVYDIPIGEWPEDDEQRQFGFLYKEQMKSLFKSMKRWWISELQVSEEEYDNVCAAALEEFEDYCSEARWIIVTAKKPES